VCTSISCCLVSVFNWSYLNRWETTNLTISYYTPLEIIEQLRSRLEKYIDDNNRDWVSFNLNIDKIEFQNAIWLIIAIQRAVEIFSRSCVTLNLFSQIVQTGKTGGVVGTAGRPSYDILKRFWRIWTSSMPCPSSQSFCPTNFPLILRHGYNLHVKGVVWKAGKHLEMQDISRKAHP
jgi:hypothetical protein